jgi:uncharacterized SAM-binding protein YcdF (DUF218 family)
MLFDLQKALGLLIMPLGLVWLFLLGMVLWSWRLRRPHFAFLLSLTWVLLTLGGSPWVGRSLIAQLERQVPVVAPAQGPLDAIFVLGGASEVDAQGRPQLGSHGDRIAEAARLWHAGQTHYLVASGRGNDALTGERDLAEETRAIWRELGVPDSAILVVKAPCYITREEIAAYRVLTREHHWARAGLLTSAYHLPRALALARKAQLDVVPLPCDSLSRPRRLRLQDAIPQQEGIRLTETALWEMVGKAVGR